MEFPFSKTYRALQWKVKWTSDFNEACCMSTFLIANVWECTLDLCTTQKTLSNQFQISKTMSCPFWPNFPSYCYPIATSFTVFSEFTALTYCNQFLQLAGFSPQFLRRNISKVWITQPILRDTLIIIAPLVIPRCSCISGGWGRGSGVCRTIFSNY